MNQQIVVSDAGPLLALAKLEALDLLARLYHVVNTSPIVFDETVTQGLALNAADASLLKESFDNGILAITAVQSSNALDEPIKIHGGERESIQLAIQLRASEFLIDDSRARKVAEQNFSTQRLSTVIRGLSASSISVFKTICYLKRKQSNCSNPSRSAATSGSVQNCAIGFCS